MLSNLKFTRKHLLFIGGMVIMVCVFYLAVYLPLRGNTKPILPSETEAVQADNKLKVTANTEMVQKIHYLKCGEEEVLRTKPAENLIGLNISQLQKVYSGWSIDKFDPQEIEMTLNVDSFCREHANNMYLGIKDGHVAVFYGKPGIKPIVKEVTKIEINKLMPQDVEELRHGMVVQSKEELLQTLEGLQSR